MMRVDGEMRTSHRNPACVAKALGADNLASMTTAAGKNHVTTTVHGTKLRSVIASVDDYLMNLNVAEEGCRYRQDGIKAEDTDETDENEVK